MSQQVLIVRCSDCQEKQKKEPPDKNNPVLEDDSDFAVVLEWKSRTEAIEELSKAKCPKCGSQNFYFTDVAEH